MCDGDAWLDMWVYNDGIHTGIARHVTELVSLVVSPPPWSLGNETGKTQIFSVFSANQTWEGLGGRYSTVERLPLSLAITREKPGS